jgi:hypothetical protein
MSENYFTTKNTKEFSRRGTKKTKAGLFAKPFEVLCEEHRVSLW